MSRTLAIVSVLLASAGCSKKQPAGSGGEHEAVAAPAAKADEPAKAAPPAKAAAGGELPSLEGPVDCAKVLPATMVTRHFAGAVVSSPTSGVCEVKKGEVGETGSIAILIQYECSVAMGDDLMASMLDNVGTRVPGLGRGAVAHDGSLQVFDNDTACILNVTTIDKIAGLDAFVRDALDTITPERLRSGGESTAGAPPAADGRVDCKALLPAALVERYYPKATIVSDLLPNACSIEQADATAKMLPSINVNYGCDRVLNDETVAGKLAATEGKKVAGLGRGAVQSKGELLAFDTDTSCSIHLSSLEAIPQAEKLAGEILDAVTPATLKAAAVKPE
jgi:hypothetical protein